MFGQMVVNTIVYKYMYKFSWKRMARENMEVAEKDTKKNQSLVTQIEIHSKYEPCSVLFVEWKIVFSERTSFNSICCLFDRNDFIEMICGGGGLDDSCAKIFKSTMYACMCVHADNILLLFDKPSMADEFAVDAAIIIIRDGFIDRNFAFKYIRFWIYVKYVAYQYVQCIEICIGSQNQVRNLTYSKISVPTSEIEYPINIYRPEIRPKNNNDSWNASELRMMN